MSSARTWIGSSQPSADAAVTASAAAAPAAQSWPRRRSRPEPGPPGDADTLGSGSVTGPLHVGVGPPRAPDQGHERHRAERFPRILVVLSPRDAHELLRPGG